MKIRLHGTLKEVEKAAEKLKNLFQVVSISSPYKDRGESELYRVYVEVRMWDI
ncbi:hypothetical protein J9303_13845 [Bacillaceae bacterium Marseille-Q3522]|nr:hypothetical protein [Bacillaceae bacterium Marseille-Q3522]